MNTRALTLALNALAVANAANAWRPVDRVGAASVPAFLAGLPTSELPLEVLGAHALANAVLARTGGFGGRAGLIGAGLSATAAFALGGLDHVARQAGGVYEDALRTALGDGYRAGIVHPAFPGPDAATACTPGLVRMARIRRRFTADHDLPYGPSGRSNLLDVWRRADLPRDAAAPVLIQTPGGGWTVGNKQGQAYPLMSHLAERGWVCVAINYRLSPRHRWPAQIVDVKRAIAWTRSHVAGYGGDPGFLVLTGGSAGGHLSSLAALTPNDPQWQPGFEGDDTSVAAAVPFYGVYDWTNRDGVGHRGTVRLLQERVTGLRLADDHAAFDAASPMSRINPATPPMLISHGVNDSLVPVEQARLFVARLRAAAGDTPIAYAELPRAQHAFDVWGTPRANAAAEAVARFLGVVYGRYRGRPPISGR